MFEYGVGESTLIASHMGVPRYSGVDSVATFLTRVRSEIPDHFRFYFADIGSTKEWGFSINLILTKSVLHFQLLPLMTDSKAFEFDVPLAIPLSVG